MIENESFVIAREEVLMSFSLLNWSLLLSPHRII